MLGDLRVNREPIMVCDIHAKNPDAQYGEDKVNHVDSSSVEGMIVVLQPARDGIPVQGCWEATSMLLAL